MVNQRPRFSPKRLILRAFSAEIAQLRRWRSAQQTVEAPGEAGLAVQKILDGVYRSAESGREVKID